MVVLQVVLESHAVLDALAAPVHRAAVRPENAAVHVPHVAGEGVAAEELLPAQEAVPDDLAVSGGALDAGGRVRDVAEVGLVTAFEGLGDGEKVVKANLLLLAACRTLVCAPRLFRHFLNRVFCEEKFIASTKRTTTGVNPM